MDPSSNPLSPRVIEGSYVPYFYESGLHRLYLGAPGRTPPASPARPHAPYDFSSEPWPWQADPGPQTVERILSSGYFAVPESLPETALISDKAHTSRLGLDDVIRQVRSRYEIYERNVYELDQAKSSTVNSILAMEADRGSVPADSRERYSLTKKLLEIDQQRREERVSLWQDVSRLRLGLPETAQSYLGAYRKMQILEDERGESP